VGTGERSVVSELRVIDDPKGGQNLKEMTSIGEKVSVSAKESECTSVKAVHLS
jgi:hypothetical protein